MELQEQVTALESEKKVYINMLDNVNNEKIALDQSYVTSIRECLGLRKDLLVRDKMINDLSMQCQEKDKSITDLNTQLQVLVEAKKQLDDCQDRNTHLSEANAQLQNTVHDLKQSLAVVQAEREIGG